MTHAIKKNERSFEAERLLINLNSIEDYAREIGAWEEVQLGINFMRTLDRAGLLDEFLDRNRHNPDSELTVIEQEILRTVVEHEKTLEKHGSHLSVITKRPDPSRRQAIGELLSWPAHLLSLGTIKNGVNAWNADDKRSDHREMAKAAREEAKQPGLAADKRTAKEAEADRQDKSADEAVFSRNIQCGYALGFGVATYLAVRLTNNLRYDELDNDLARMIDFSTKLHDIHHGKHTKRSLDI